MKNETLWIEEDDLSKNRITFGLISEFKKEYKRLISLNVSFTSHIPSKEFFGYHNRRLFPKRLRRQS